jgi:DNA polymerase-3 subunit epsilon
VASSGLIDRWRAALTRAWRLRRLKDPAFRSLFDPPPPDEWVAIDCQTTGLDVRRDEIIAIDAVRIRGRRLLTSERLELLVRPEQALSPELIRVHRLREQDVAAGLAPAEAARRVLEFIGARPLVGYYLEFDVAMLDRLVRPLIGVGLPQPRIEVSALYYRHKFRQLPPHAHQDNVGIDLRFASMMADLALPWGGDTQAAPSEAVMAGLAFVKLRALAGE